MGPTIPHINNQQLADNHTAKAEPKFLANKYFIKDTINQSGLNEGRTLSSLLREPMKISISISLK